MDQENQNVAVVALTADIVAAYVRHNSVVVTEVPTLIAEVFDALSKAARVTPGNTLEEL
ncbi:unnamed protein product, partial [Scytosiphon promiscuus]